MKKDRLICYGIIFLAVFLVLTSFVSATYMRSTPQYTMPGFSYGSSSFSGSFVFDREMCEAGQDFMVQIAPLGCSPTVVRSDLLEEQNVAVFCQLAATKLNPLIDIETIDYMTFSGDYSNQVATIGYHPNKAALSITEEITQPVMDNIGYAVIVLKQQPNESALTNCETSDLGSEVCWVEGNLTANIRYDIKNAFGVGKATFYLPVLDDDEFDEQYAQYGFWSGKGFLRAEGVDDYGATIGVYSGLENSGLLGDGYKQRVSLVDLEEGDTSPEIYLPTLDFCMASMELRLDGLENPDTRAKLRVNADVYEVAEGEQFLDSQCRVVKIEKSGLNKLVRISCKEDEGRSTFDLRIVPQLSLEVDGKVGNYQIGDALRMSNGDVVRSSDKQKVVYLAYAETMRDSGNIEDLFAYFVAIPDQGERLDDATIKNYARQVKNLYNSNTDNFFDAAKTTVKAFSELFVQSYRTIIDGENPSLIKYGEPKKVQVGLLEDGPVVSIEGLAGAQDLNYGDIEYLDEAMDDYNEIIDSFSTEQYDYPQTFGELSMYQKILLARDTGQKRTMIDYCDEFENTYPNSNLSLPSDCSNELLLSSEEVSMKEVEIDGEVKLISFENVYEPTYDDYGAEVVVEFPDDHSEIFKMTKGRPVYISDDEYLTLTDLTETSARVEGSVRSGGLLEALSGVQYQLSLDDSQPIGEGYIATLTDVNLKKTAKVSVIPNIDYARSEASFQFKIGVEKRGIQLSPEKTEDLVDTLEGSIEKWERLSDNLGTVVKGMKAACIGTSTILITKNLIENAGGKGIARQTIMRGTNGWYERCAEMVNNNEYVSQDSCLLDKANEIEDDVNQLNDVLQTQNDNIKAIQDSIKTNKFLGDDLIDTNDFMQEYTEEVDLSGLPSSVVNPNNPSETISMEEMNQILTYDGWDNNIYSVEQLREIELYSMLLEEDPNNELAQERVYSLLSDVKINSGNYISKSTWAGELNVGSDDIPFLKTNLASKTLYYSGYYKEQIGVSIPGLDSDTPVQPVQTDSGNYIVALEDSGTNTYTILRDKEGGYVVYDSAGNLLSQDQIPSELKKVSFEKFVKGTYENEYINPELKYYETEPYKGLPAIVPFDVKDGWYAGIKTTLAVGSNIASYDDSGRVNSFYLCNVGSNGQEEFFSGIGDDICQMINPGLNQPYTQFYGLDETEASRLVTQAINAIEDASSKYEDGVKSVRINGETIKVGNPATAIPDIQCQDFMSPKECNLIFNLCDPVICPSSRCDFGGNYPVQDVIQSGIVGSLALCLPNFREGIYVPICITGVKAGMDNLISVQKSYRDCLEESLDSGETVGICDEIHSIYLCEFFWSQSVPLVKLAIPKIMSIILGQTTRGGGEYLGVANAWTNTEETVDYFTQTYAANSFKAFKYRTTENVGGEVCGAFASVAYPSGGSFFDSLIEADSPAQFTARFDEIPFTTTTNPPVSQYKVYYHIYAGEDTGAYYRVYLRGSSGSSYYQDTAYNRIVASGYAPIGEYASETVDFTAPSGYSELCVVVNGQEECGFEEVTTSFAANYITDAYLASQASETGITTESACISGTASLYDLLDLNVQSAIENSIDPSIYQVGITRICATNNPGEGTDSYAGLEGSRWVEVGYCDDTDIKCWLDTKSVEDAIDFSSLEDKALGEASDYYLEALQKEGDYIQDFDSAIGEIEEESDSISKINLINDIFDKVLFNSQRAYLIYLRGLAYGKLAVSDFEDLKKSYIAAAEDELEQEGNINVAITDNSDLIIPKTLLEGYAKYASLFEKYSQENLPEGWDEIEFRAVLVAFSEKETSVGTAGNKCGLKSNDPCSDWLMGYTDGKKYPEKYRGAENQISVASRMLQTIFEGKNTQSYASCNDISNLQDKIKCVASIYYSGKPYDKAFNRKGKNYADNFMKAFAKWENYFRNGVYEISDIEFMSKYDLDAIINGRIDPPAFWNVVEGEDDVFCAKYARVGAEEFFGLYYHWTDAWCRSLDGFDTVVWEADSRDSSNNYKLEQLEGEGILEPGMIVGVYYQYSSYNGLNKTCLLGKDSSGNIIYSNPVQVKYTHNLLYLGRNDKGEMVFVQYIHSEPLILTLDEFDANHFTAMAVFSAPDVLNEDSFIDSSSGITLDDSFKVLNQILGDSNNPTCENYTSSETNKAFIDNLYSSGIISEDEYNEIKSSGNSWIKLEGDCGYTMDEVKDLLQEKQLSLDTASKYPEIKEALADSEIYTLDVDEIEAIDNAEICEDCGGGYFDGNRCDENECVLLGKVLGLDCYYDDSGGSAFAKCTADITVNGVTLTSQQKLIYDSADECTDCVNNKYDVVCSKNLCSAISSKVEGGCRFISATLACVGN